MYLKVERLGVPYTGTAPQPVMIQSSRQRKYTNVLLLPTGAGRRKSKLTLYDTNREEHRSKLKQSTGADRICGKKQCQKQNVEKSPSIGHENIQYVQKT